MEISIIHFVKNTIYTGDTIDVKDEDLIDVLQFIIPQQRKIVLLYYFLGLNDVEIGKLLKVSGYSVRNRRVKALNKLKAFLDAKGYEP